MEESPHKCPVCNRSFNQRSNLKTHLLTHTDHKPYECSCGKVFRRNCDLRRHALTHAVGDVPGLDHQSDSNQDDIQNVSDGEDDAVLEVDSPLNSPNASGRSPSPINMPVSAELQDELDEVEECGQNGGGGGVDIEIDPPPTPAPEKPEKDVIAVTHCHHERSSGSQSPYTMRPQNPYHDREMMMMRQRSPTPSGSGSLISSQYLSQSQDSLNSVHIHPTAAANSRADIFMPMLHVRRDLHHKLNRSSSTITSGLVDNSAPNFLSSIPLRKRPIGADGEPYLPSLSRNIGLYNLHRNHPLLKSTEVELLVPPIITSPDSNQDSHHSSPLPQLIGSPPILSSSSNHSASSVGSSNQAPSTSNGNASAAPPKRTGFSIEDIMRR
jgi:odd-skipped-like protein